MSWNPRAAQALQVMTLLAGTLTLAACGGESGSGATVAQNETTTTASVALSSPTYSVKQSSGSVTVSVARSGDTQSASSVTYASHDGTAVAGTDYTAVSGTLSWAAGDTANKTISIPVNSASTFSGSKSFTVSLSDPGTGVDLSTPSAATVTISSTTAQSGGGGTQTPAPAGALQLSAATYTVSQSDGQFVFAVNRTGGSANAVAVSYSTADGTAIAGTDYTATDGEVTWADGDSDAKSIPVAINSAAAFTGTKTFKIALTTTTGGATVGTPATANVTINGSGPTGVVPGGGSGAPSAVKNLQLINQGGSSNDTNAATNIQQISWAAATAGSYPISYYRIYRNGAAYATTTTLTYTDKNATNSNSPTYSLATTVYAYDVTAVDTQGTEGPKSTQMSVYAYQNGLSNWMNYDLTYGSVVENYASTAGTPQGGKYDISIAVPNGGFQPTAHWPQAPIDDLEIGAFKYLVVDVNPGPNVNYALQVGTVSRLPPGDVYGWGPTRNAFDYGPKPVANTWATYKIPLADLNMGVCSFTGSITGTKLKVTAVAAGCFVDAAGFVTGGSVPSGTYITAFDQQATIGTFTVAGPGINASTNIASTTLTYQRTSLYKMTIFPNSNQTLYLNNLGFTRN